MTEISSHRIRRFSSLALRSLAISLILSLGCGLSSHAIERWDVFELSLAGPAAANPYLDVQCSASFTQGDRRVEVPGFWDGGNTYKFRFSPPTPGEWRYETHSDAPALNGRTGTFTATASTGNNHGPVEVFEKYYLRYADGTAYHQFGTTCYAWVHQPEAMKEQTLETLSKSPFNKIRFCVFPKAYAYNRNEPERFAFEKGTDGKFDFNRPDPEFWRHLERRIVDLQKLGIEADLILWHPYDRWGFADMGRAEDDRYLRYCIARLSAYRNVWWSLANEFDLMAPGAMAGHRGNKEMTDWDRFFKILQEEDPHQRMRGIHNCRGFYDHTRPWVTHTSVQNGALLRVLEWREQYGKPVLVDECGYEGNITQGWGKLSAQEMVRRVWIGTMHGGYVGHGETYQHPEELLWWSKGGVLHGESPKRIQWLKDLMADAPPFHELQPLGGADSLLLAKAGEYYLRYALKPGPDSIALAGDRPYKMDAIDPWAMTITPLGTAQAGEFSFTVPQADLVMRFTPYASGEALRPEAKITASATEGQPPLSVQFGSAGASRVQWDFGDGNASDDPSPTHVFQNPGFYSVALTVTDPDGGSARSYVQIAVDRNVDQPIVRAGIERDEHPPLKLHGSAKRAANGALHLPDGAPWGWAASDADLRDELRGLRSFTIMGWVKPESLEVGSGGNRILFCLNRDHSGIDLVALEDGRLRLAVNQWPDSVRNDSSPGKLLVGKWTSFAVTYDATRSSDNVSWYFGPPMDTPGKAAFALDRTTTHDAGPVGSEVAALAIGNFNETMHSYGLDRQFRGEIRTLQLFGSRVDGRGAFSVPGIHKHAK